MEIISLFVVLSIVACLIFIGMATIRLIQAEDQPNAERRRTQHADKPSNDLLYSAAKRTNVATLRTMKAKT